MVGGGVMKRFFMTGGAGTVASCLSPYFSRSEITRTDIRRADDVAELALCDPRLVAEAMAGHDTVIHAVGVGWKKPDAEIEASMIPPFRCVLDAMKIAGVKRIVLLSSMHVVADYELGECISPASPPRTSSFYGQMHVLREKMVREFGLSASIIRIGVVSPKPRGTRRDRAIWISPRDLATCIRYAADITSPRCPVIWGCSGTNEDHEWVHSDGRFDAVDNAEKFPLVDAEKWCFIGGPLVKLHAPIVRANS